MRYWEIIADDLESLRPKGLPRPKDLEAPRESEGFNHTTFQKPNARASELAGIQLHIAIMESVSLPVADEKLIAFLELEAATVALDVGLHAQANWGADSLGCKVIPYMKIRYRLTDKLEQFH